MANPIHFRSYFKFLGRNKLYTLINVFGLSVSLTFVILIAVYTRQELSVDKFQKNADRIYVLGNEKSFGSGYGLAPYLYSRYPEIDKITALHSTTETVSIEETRYNAKMQMVDSTFLDIFSFKIIEGGTDAIRGTTELIVSESFARKAFGQQSPIGKVIKISDELSMPVGGVVEDFKNSMIPEADILMNAQLIEGHFNGGISNKHMNNAGGVVFFIMTHEGTDLRSKTADMEEYFKEFYWIYTRDLWKAVTLTPMTEAYFSSFDDGGHFSLNHGDRSLVTILISVGILILIFAIINYVNLTVAQTGFRAKEMASRRLLGASGKEIFLKFILESIIICMFAFVVGLLLAAVLEGMAGKLLQTKLDVAGSIDMASGTIALLMILLLGTVSGIIPALFISKYQPIDVVRGSFRHTSKMVFSRVFIVFQNVITIALIAGSLTMLLQIRHMINAPLGYNMDNVIYVDPNGFNSMENVSSFKNELLQLASVKDVSTSQGTPLDRGNNWTIIYKEKNLSFQIFNVDSAFMRILDIEIIKDNHVAVNGVWLNQQALSDLELEEGVSEFTIGDRVTPIAGIVKDFRLGTALADSRNPVIISIHPKDIWPWNFLVQVQGDPDAAMADVKRTYENFTGLEFSGKYMHDMLEETFKGQKRIYTIVLIFTLVAILISMLGLLAMSSYFIQQREKDIAVRKVFGSTRGEIFRKLVFNFLKLVLMAFVIATPVIWYIMRQWLMDYPYRIKLSPLIFIAAGLAAFIVATITVSWQSARAANENPVDSMKKE